MDGVKKGKSSGVSVQGFLRKPTGKKKEDVKGGWGKGSR